MQIEAALAQIDGGYPLYDQKITAGDLMADEYRALAERIPDLREDEDFVTEHHTDEWRALRDGLEAGGVRRVASTVSRLIAVDRLKEVMVLKGFQRVGGRVTPPDLTGASDWLPALELYGEGIFLPSTRRCCSAGRPAQRSSDEQTTLRSGTTTATVRQRRKATSKCRRASCCATRSPT